MSRIGKQPVVLPAGVEAAVAGNDVTIKGPKGSLIVALHPHDLLIESKPHDVEQI